MNNENKIKIKLAKQQATLLDLQIISRDTAQVLILLSVLEDTHNESKQEFIRIMKQAYLQKKSAFIYRKTIRHYLDKNIDKFNFISAHNGSVILTIKVSICIYKIFKILNTKEVIDKEKLLHQALECVTGIAKSMDDVEEIIDIIAEQYGVKIEDFFKNYEIDF